MKQDTRDVVTVVACSVVALILFPVAIVAFAKWWIWVFSFMPVIR